MTTHLYSPFKVILRCISFRTAAEHDGSAVMNLSCTIGVRQRYVGYPPCNCRAVAGSGRYKEMSKKPKPSSTCSGDGTGTSASTAVRVRAADALSSPMRRGRSRQLAGLSVTYSCSPALEPSNHAGLHRGQCGGAGTDRGTNVDHRYGVRHSDHVLENNEVIISPFIHSPQTLPVLSRVPSSESRTSTWPATE
jgi:hypothetical protein